MFNISVIWLLLSFCFLLFEMGNPGLFFFLSFSFSSIINSLCSFFIADYAIQTIIFVINSIIIMAILKKFLSSMYKQSPTNVDALKGRHVPVCDGITPTKTGLVKVDGVLWTALSGDGGSYQPGTLVTITSIRGTHIVVKLSQTNSLS